MGQLAQMFAENPAYELRYCTNKQHLKKLKGNSTKGNSSFLPTKMSIEPVGFMAGIVTTTCILPQLYKMWITKSARDVSLAMYVCLMCGQILWTIHGIIVTNITLLIFTTISILTCCLTVMMKVRYSEINETIPTNESIQSNMNITAQPIEVGECTV